MLGITGDNCDNTCKRADLACDATKIEELNRKPRVSRLLEAWSCGVGGFNVDLKGVIFGLYWGSIGIMEQKMETTRVYWGYIGSRILGLYGYIWAILGLYRNSELKPESRKLLRYLTAVPSK